MKILSLGEVLWDIFPDKEILGGAPLNFCANIIRLGNSAHLITAVGSDERGRLALQRMHSLGIDTQFVQVVRDLPTGTATVSVSKDGEPRFEIPRPAAFDLISLQPETLETLRLSQPDWLYFGTLLHVAPQAENTTSQLVESIPAMRCFYDMNLRPDNWNFPLVERLCKLASILKLNEFEAQTLGSFCGLKPETFSLKDFCQRWLDRYALDVICVTLGAAGCFVFTSEGSHTVPGFSITVEDTVGAGDAFAAAFLHGYNSGWPMPRTARFANALGAIVAARPGATPSWTLEECIHLAATPLEQIDADQH